MGRPGKDWVVLAETEEDQGSRTLVRNIETFRRVDQFYRRGCEVHRIRLFDTAALLDRLTGGGEFSTETSQAYSTQQLALGGRAFFPLACHRRNQHRDRWRLTNERFGKPCPCD
jgi:hypothetical protein